MAAFCRQHHAISWNTQNEWRKIFQISRLVQECLRNERFFFYFIKFCISIYIFSFSLLWISFGFIFFSVLKLRSPFWIWKERSYLMGKINFFDQLKSFAFIEYFHFVYCQNFKENFSAFKLYGKQCFPTNLIKAQHFSYSTSASSLELWKKFLVADSLIKLLTFM